MERYASPLPDRKNGSILTKHIGAALVLSDGSSSGDWRLPTMKELCTLIDDRRRNPALPNGHKFWVVPAGSCHWSATKLDYYSGMAWIVYVESGTTIYEDIKNRAGYIWPVRKNNFCICEFKTDHKRLKKSHNKSLERPANSAVRIFSPYEHDRGNHFRWLIPGRRSL